MRVHLLVPAAVLYCSIASRLNPHLTTTAVPVVLLIPASSLLFPSSSLPCSLRSSSHRRHIQRLEEFLREWLPDQVLIVEPVGIGAEVDRLRSAPAVPPARIEHQCRNDGSSPQGCPRAGWSSACARCRPIVPCTRRITPRYLCAWVRTDASCSRRDSPPAYP